MKKVQQAHEKARRQGKIPQDRVTGSLSEVAEVYFIFRVSPDRQSHLIIRPSVVPWRQSMTLTKRPRL